MTLVKEVLVAYMREHGFSGLRHPELDCACSLEMLGGWGICDGKMSDCELGYKISCNQKCLEGEVVSHPKQTYCVSKNKNYKCSWDSWEGKQK